MFGDMIFIRTFASTTSNFKLYLSFSYLGNLPVRVNSLFSFYIYFHPCLLSQEILSYTDIGRHI